MADLEQQQAQLDALQFEVIRRPLAQALESYQGLGRYRFHVPGHSGRPLVEGIMGWSIPGVSPEMYLYDQTEVEGLDVLSEPQGCLQEAQAAVATAYNVAHTFFSVNGATAGIMAALLAALQPGDEVLLPRNVHRSVINALVLTGAVPVWFLPPWLEEWGLWGALSPDTVSHLIQTHPKARALVVTSPTYEGIGSDIAALSARCRESGLTLIVDEAHGSLWPFAMALPASAIRLGADVVVQSLHKTAGSLTQTALVHLPCGSEMAPEALQEALNTVQTTSPSYVLMASLEAAALMLASPEGGKAIEAFTQRVDVLRSRFTQEVEGFELFDGVDGIEGSGGWDFTKIYIRHGSESGQDWAVRLECEERLAYESTSPYGSLYLAQLGLVDEDYHDFIQIFKNEGRQRREMKEIEGQMNAKEGGLKPLWKTLRHVYPPLPEPICSMLPRQAFFAPGQWTEAPLSVGRVAKQTLVHCPPGVPVLIPGEIIQPEHLPYLEPRVQVVR